MKIEMDGDACTAVCVLSICTMVVLVAFFIYRYNIVAWEQGYTQQQLQNSQQVMWVKNK